MADEYMGADKETRSNKKRSITDDNAYNLLMPLIVQEVSHDAHRGIKCEKGKENHLHCVAT